MTEPNKRENISEELIRSGLVEEIVAKIEEMPVEEGNLVRSGQRRGHGVAGQLPKRRLEGHLELPPGAQQGWPRPPTGAPGVVPSTRLAWQSKQW